MFKQSMEKEIVKLSQRDVIVDWIKIVPQSIKTTKLKVAYKQKGGDGKTL